jgi:4-methylaminobutanoate oxidase (formaldehyde-forming)
MARHVHHSLVAASAGLTDAHGHPARLVNAGYYALDALRIEAGRRAWGAELGPDETPLQAGLMFAVKLDKPTPFIGQAALQRAVASAAPPTKKLVTVVLGNNQDYAWGGESILWQGKPAGDLTSVGYSLRAGACVGHGYLRGEAAAQVHHGSPVQIDLWGTPVVATAWDRWPTP